MEMAVMGRSTFETAYVNDVDTYHSFNEVLI